VIVTCWSVKGGSGTSVVAAALAVQLASERTVLAIDLAGDMPAVLGLATPDGPGVLDWLHAGSGVGEAALDGLATPAAAGLRVVHRGHDEPDRQGRWAALAEVLTGMAGDVVIDAGRSPLPVPLAHVTAESVLVLRPCYLALRRASASIDRPSGVVLIDEPGRALGRRDVEQVLGVRVIAEAGTDPAVARAVDAGLLAARLPATLRQMASNACKAFDAAGVPRSVVRS
jgi:cellulose biosynthesis protein BcsQ